MHLNLENPVFLDDVSEKDIADAVVQFLQSSDYNNWEAGQELFKVRLSKTLMFRNTTPVDPYKQTEINLVCDALTRYNKGENPFHIDYRFSCFEKLLQGYKSSKKMNVLDSLCKYHITIDSTVADVPYTGICSNVSDEYTFVVKSVNLNFRTVADFFAGSTKVTNTRSIFYPLHKLVNSCISVR